LYDLNNQASAALLQPVIVEFEATLEQ
jgi:hypothetical protein